MIARGFRLGYNWIIIYNGHGDDKEGTKSELSCYWFVSDYKEEAAYLDMKDIEKRVVVGAASDA